MARNKEFDQNKVLHNALDVFWQKGYANTSIQDLVDKIGLGRGSIYNAFDSKHGLFLEVLDDYLAKRGATLVKKLKVSPIKGSFQKYFHEAIDEMVNDPDNKGCFIVNTMTEMSAIDEVVKAKLLKSEEDLIAAYAEALQYGVDRGELTLKEDPIMTARFLSATMKGLRVISKVDQTRDNLEAIAAMALVVL